MTERRGRAESLVVAIYTIEPLTPIYRLQHKPSSYVTPRSTAQSKLARPGSRPLLTPTCTAKYKSLTQPNQA